MENAQSKTTTKQPPQSSGFRLVNETMPATPDYLQPEHPAAAEEPLVEIAEKESAKALDGAPQKPGWFWVFSGNGWQPARVDYDAMHKKALVAQVFDGDVLVGESMKKHKWAKLSAPDAK